MALVRVHDREKEMEARVAELDHGDRALAMMRGNEADFDDEEGGEDKNGCGYARA